MRRLLACALVAWAAHAGATTCLPERWTYQVTVHGVFYLELDERDPERSRLARVEGADPASFTVIGPERPGACDAWRQVYAKDRDGVYGRGKRISGKPASFRLLGEGFATDGEKHFHGDLVIAEPGFELLKWGYARTAKRVFRRGAQLAGADPASFEVLHYDYARTRDFVYVDGRRLEGADAGTFELRWPTNRMAVDRNRVYYLDKVVPGADPATYEPVSAFYLFRDRRAVYLEGREIPGADPATVHASRFNTYVVDAKSVFRGTQRLDRDAATFQELQPFYSLDRNGVYYRDEPLPGADVATFKATALDRAEDRNFRYHARQVLCRFGPPAAGVASCPP